MSVDNFRLSLSVDSFLALQVLLADDYKRGSYDVTFFFAGPFFGITTSAAVACNPSVRVVKNASVEKRS